LVIKVLKNNPNFKIVNLTACAPEMNLNFRWFVAKVSELDIKIIVRSNLTIIKANKKHNDLPDFFKLHKIEIISSFPFYSKTKTNKQRGDSIFQSLIEALQMLHDVGYGKPNSGLSLNLVYNPAGAFLPPDQTALEKEYRNALLNDFGIEFTNLCAITNLPASSYLDYLISLKNFEHYLTKLIDAFNPIAAANIMYRNTISIGWNGYLYNCDFNQMLERKVSSEDSQHLLNFNIELLSERTIIISNHRYGRTAGAGSSCGGVLAY
jgi:radical SAM/Cys-rich protein